LSNFDFLSLEFRNLVNEKLKESNYEYHIDEFISILNSQIKTDLLPVLNQKYNFNLDEIYGFVLNFKI
jgi:hypothetical protein